MGKVHDCVPPCVHGRSENLMNDKVFIIIVIVQRRLRGESLPPLGYRVPASVFACSFRSVGLGLPYFEEQKKKKVPFADVYF